MGRSDRRRQLVTELENEAILRRDLDVFASFRSDRRWRELQAEIARERRAHRRRLTAWWSAAAAVVLVAVGIVLWPKPQPEVKVTVAEVKTEPAQVLSGVVLLSDSGDAVSLEGLADTVLEFGGREKVAISRGKGLQHEATDTLAPAVWYTLRIPRGGEFHLTLADGSQVWMNSESELRYPSRFEGDCRRVELRGEAYFEVKRDEGMPFRVASERMEVEVLGTSFNMSVYPGDKRMHVSLVSGKVAVTAGEGEMVLQPNEQALLEDGRLTSRKVNASLYAAWRKDRFICESEGMEEVMRKLCRWYDVEYFFKNDAQRRKLFSGTLLKYADIRDVLRVIEMTTDVKLTLNDRTIYIE